MRVLVAGATGVVGSAAVSHFLDEGADVVAVSRRMPQIDSRRPFLHVPLDLRDRDAVANALGPLDDVTHVVYAALYEKPGLISGWVDHEQIETNASMLGNTIDALIGSGAPLRHVSLLQGTKAYGYHVTKMRLPAKEDQPRVEHDNFYWAQQDYLKSAAADHGFEVTIFRPQFIFGDAHGAAMNLIPVIGVYAAGCRELGEPFSFPGGHSYLAEAVDARLLAKALGWAATAENARNETFNVTNGDVFERRDLWPSLGSALGVECGPDRPRSLAAWLPAHRSAWTRIAEREGLQERDLIALLGESHHYADNAFAWTEDGRRLESRDQPVLLSTIKLRQAGFASCVDTAEMFEYWFRRLQRQRVIPVPPS